MIVLDKKNAQVKVFEDVDTYISYLRNTEVESGRQTSSLRNDSSFHGKHSYEKCLDLCQFGDEELYEQIINTNVKVGDIKSTLEKITHTENLDVVGHIPHVPNAIIGIPKNMINVKQTRVATKILNIFVSLTANGGTDFNDIQQNAIRIAKAIDYIESMGYRCNVWSGDFGTNGSNTMGYAVRIKTDAQPLNLMTMAFPLCSASMFRRLGFRMIELSKFDFTHSGYGSVENRQEKIEPLLCEAMNLEKISVLSVTNGDSTGSISEIIKNVSL